MKKNLAQRLKEVRHLYQQLEALGLHEEVEQIAEFRKIADEFVRNGVPLSGEIPIPFARRVLVYELTSSAKHSCSILMKSY